MSKDPGTPETRARLAPHPIDMLLKRNYISQEHFDAAWQIEEAFLSLTSPVSLRMMRFDGEGYELRPPSFLAHLTSRQEAQVRAYNDWVRQLVRMERPDIHGAVVDAMTEAITLRQIEQQRRWRNGTAKARIRAG